MAEHQRIGLSDIQGHGVHDVSIEAPKRRYTPIPLDQHVGAGLRGHDQHGHLLALLRDGLLEPGAAHGIRDAE
jgi:hypothetical protein